MSSANRRRLWGFGFALLCVAAALVGVARMWEQLRPLSFDPTIWKRDNCNAIRLENGRELSSATRDRMVVDLLKRYQLVGMQRANVVALLGEPDLSRTEPFPDWDMIYWLGPDARWPMGALDRMWLVLKLDSTGKVIQCQTTYD